MKKQLLIIASAGIILAGCSINTNAKTVKSLSDFVEVASAASITADDAAIKLTSTNAKTKRSTGTHNGYTPDTIVAHSASVFKDNAFQLPVTENNQIVYEKTVGNKTHYYVIDTAKKMGYIYLDGTELEQKREQVNDYIATDYSSMDAVYQSFKDNVGKKGYSITMAQNGNTIGYTMKYTVKGDFYTTKYVIYLTLDHVTHGDQSAWCYSQYSKRVTHVFDDGGFVDTYYDVVEYQFGLAGEYSTHNLSSTGYTIVFNGITMDGVDAGADETLMSGK